MSQLTTKEWVIQTITPIALPFVRLYWFVFRPHTEGVKVILENEQDELLLVRHTYGSRDWTFPGGSMKSGESPAQTARREMKEELSVQIYDLQVHGSFVSTKEYKRDHITVCSGRVTEKLNRSPFEIAETKWFGRDSLPELGEVTEETLSIYGQSI